MRRRALLGSLLLLSACDSGGTAGTGRVPSTAIVVEPAAFLGDVPCVEAEGALRRYVATLFDVSPPPIDGSPFGDLAFPSSAPAPCHLGVRFTLVEPGRRYVAEIDGYDTVDLAPLSPGSRVMVDASGAVVRPRWTTACGRDPAGPSGDAGIATSGAEAGAGPTDGGRPDLTGPVISIAQSTIPIRGCRPLVDQRPTATATAIVLDLSAALVGENCGPPGVDAFSVTLRETGETRSGRCAEPMRFEGLEDRVEYHFDVAIEDAAYEGGMRTTLCYRVAQAGLTLPAACDPL